jgi:hypothetical protein
MVARGNGLFRYGTMNFTYLLASLGVLAISLSGVISLARAPFFPRVERWISLSGLRSFAVVPPEGLTDWPADGCTVVRR